MGLGGHAEVYDAEMAGFMMSATQTTNCDNTITRIHFFADNAAAVAIFLNPQQRLAQHYSGVSHEKICEFFDSNPTSHVEISWCSGHSDFPGNVRADELAKEAT